MMSLRGLRRPSSGPGNAQALPGTALRPRPGRAFFVWLVNSLAVVALWRRRCGRVIRSRRKASSWITFGSYRGLFDTTGSSVECPSHGPGTEVIATEFGERSIGCGARWGVGAVDGAGVVG